MISVVRTLSATGPYDPVLDNGVAPLVQWSFQRANASFNPSGTYMQGYVIAGSNADVTGSGSGYVLTIEDNGGTNDDRWIFGRYTGGLGTGSSDDGFANVTELFELSSSVIPGFGNNLTARVDFNQNTGTWSVFGVQTLTGDPTTFGAGELLGSVVDTTYTGLSLGVTGFVFDHGATTAVRGFSTDNFSVTAIPEPSTAVILLAGMASFLARRRR